MQVKVRVVEGFTAKVLSYPVVLSAAPVRGENRNFLENREQLFGTIGLKHPHSGEFILNYAKELKLVNHRGDQILYTTTLTKENNPGSSRCNLNLTGKRLGKAGIAGNYYGSITITIEYL